MLSYTSALILAFSYLFPFLSSHDLRRILNDHGLIMTDVAWRRAFHFVNASKVRLYEEGPCFLEQ